MIWWTLIDFLAYWLLHRPCAALCGAVPRSSHWPAVRRAWLAEHPACEVCGSKDSPEAHHVVPFELDHRRELDPTNLITLGRNCGHHLTFGHCGDFKSENFECRSDVAHWKRKYMERP